MGEHFRYFVLQSSWNLFKINWENQQRINIKDCNKKVIRENLCLLYIIKLTITYIIVTPAYTTYVKRPVLNMAPNIVKIPYIDLKAKINKHLYTK